MDPPEKAPHKNAVMAKIEIELNGKSKEGTEQANTACPRQTAGGGDHGQNQFL
jgi:hypothetical protein